MNAPILPQSAGWHDDPKRGAALGRVDTDTAAPGAPLKFNLQRVRINSGGYDSGGAYWGLGQPLYWACSQDGEVDKFFRAANRIEAKAELCDEYPNAKFFR